MKRRFAAVWLLTAALAAALYFVYDRCPSPLVGLLAPVNESVWEQLKPLFWPFLLAGFVLCRGLEDQQRAWSGFLLALTGMPAAVLGVHYTLRSGFGVSAPAVDWALRLLVLTLGFVCAYRFQKSGSAAWAAGVLVIAAGLYGAALILFTMAPPQLPVFLPE